MKDFGTYQVCKEPLLPKAPSRRTIKFRTHHVHKNLHQVYYKTVASLPSRWPLLHRHAPNGGKEASRYISEEYKRKIDEKPIVNRVFKTDIIVDSRSSSRHTTRQQSGCFGLVSTLNTLPPPRKRGSLDWSYLLYTEYRAPRYMTGSLKNR